MKKDLTELKDTVQQETSPYLSSTASAISSSANYVKETLSSLVDEGEEYEVDENGEKVAKTKSDEDASTNTDNSQKCNVDFVRNPLTQQRLYLALKNNPDGPWPESLTEKVASVFTTLVDALSPQLGDDEDDEVILSGRLTIPRERWEILLNGNCLLEMTNSNGDSWQQFKATRKPIVASHKVHPKSSSRGARIFRSLSTKISALT